jgi:hypothetical protein
MASRLNLLFQTAPKQFLEKTVLLSDELTSAEAQELMRNRIAHYIDIQPLQERTTARVLAGLHLYSDTPLRSYFVSPGRVTIIQKNDPPYRFVFLPEFNHCRLLIRAEGDEWLRLECEEGLAGPVLPRELEKDSPYLDSFAYWDYTRGELVGRIRATAVLVKEQNQPWTVLMQQIVGTPGHEVVRSVFSRTLRY